MPGHRRTSPPLSRAERRALIDDAVMIRPLNAARPTAAEVAAVVRAVDATERATAEARARMAADAQRAQDAAQAGAPRDDRRAKLRFYLLFFVFFMVFGMAHEVVISWLIRPQALAYVYPFTMLASVCAAGWAAARLSPPPR